jgi:hypothetical protein
MFTVEDIDSLAKSSDLVIDRYGIDKGEDGRATSFDNAKQTFVDHLNEFTKTFMPGGAPALTLSRAQAEIVRDLLAPGWCMHMIKITAFEQLAHLPMYATTLGSKQAYGEVAAARQAVAQIEYVLSSIVMQRPQVEPSAFIQFAQDPETKIVAPLYNHLMALQYAEQLTRVWQSIEVFAEGEAN